MNARTEPRLITPQYITALVAALQAETLTVALLLLICINASSSAFARSMCNLPKTLELQSPTPPRIPTDLRPSPRNGCSQMTGRRARKTRTAETVAHGTCRISNAVQRDTHLETSWCGCLHLRASWKLERCTITSQRRALQATWIEARDV